MEPHIVSVHGISVINPFYYWSWQSAIPELNKFRWIPVKWKCRSWDKDLFNIFFSKSYRDDQIAKVIKALEETGKEPTILLSHSFGTVWAYKAWRRMGNTLQKPVWSVMIGSALGGTKIPFGGPYIDCIIEEYKNYTPPSNIEKLYNMFNNDDYVSSRIFMNRMENFKIDPGSFHPGFQEHNPLIYMKSMEFTWIIQQFLEKYKPAP